MILRTVVGASEAARLAALRAVMPRVLNLDPWSTLAIYNRKLQQRRPWSNVSRRLEGADALLYAEIADRRSDPELAARTDVLAMLVRAADGLTDLSLGHDHGDRFARLTPSHYLPASRRRVHPGHVTS